MAPSHKPTRRELLKASGAGSLAVGSIGIVGASSSDDTVEIVKIRTGEQYPDKTEEVPADWYEHLQDTRKAKQRLTRRYGNRRWFKTIGHEPTNRSFSGKRGFSVVIERTDAAKADRELPEQANGVAVGHRQLEEPPAYSGHCTEPDYCPSGFGNTETYSCVPGGASIGNAGDSYAPTYTGTWPIDYDGNSAYLTVSHGPADDYNTGDCPSGSILGAEITQGEFQEPLGQVVEYDYQQDFSVVDPYDGVNLSDEIVPEDVSVYGHVTEDGVDSYQADGTTTHLYGARSDQKLNHQIVSHFDWNPCEQSTDGPNTAPYVRFEGASGCGGDSGGPHYVTDSLLGIGTILALFGPNYGGCLYNGTESSRCPAAYGIANEYPVSFTWSSSDCA